MLKNCLLVSDLHLTVNPRDEYRWKIFEQMRNYVTKYKIGTVIIAGDLTDAKDNHSGILVNRLIHELAVLAQETKPYPRVVILRGNHDGINPDWPFFMFLNSLNGVEFIAFPKRDTIANATVILLPHTKIPEQKWKYWLPKCELAEVCIAHMTVTGAHSEHNQVLKGIDKKWLHEIGIPIYSGDVHVPQVIKNLTYIGAPYPIKFGDSFTPGCIYFDRAGEEYRIDLKNIKRALITVRRKSDLAQLDDLKEEDQVKVRIKLPRSSLPEWSKLQASVKLRCKNAKIDLVSCDLRLEEDIEDEEEERIGPILDPFADYCQSKQLRPRLVQVGKSCLEAAKGE